MTSGTGGAASNPEERRRRILVARSKEQANFPFLVQTRPTENWTTRKAYTALEDAIVSARQTADLYPGLPVRVLHCTGGPMK